LLTSYVKFYFPADPGKMPLLGDVLVIAGTVGFAFSNVGEVSYICIACICCYQQQFLTVAV